ncbi:MAG: hypothetical protein ACRC8S_06600 [Fimbriiglobus sp.]
MISLRNETELIQLSESVYNLVWRFDFATPGFAVLDIPPGPDSHQLRAWMVKLKGLFSEISVRRGHEAFAYQSMSRFDQQVTTKFHLDGAPAQSLLILAYEPSVVQSRLFLADYTRAAFDLGLSPEQFLKTHNPMYKAGEDLVARYVTELPHPVEGHSRIVVINNSSLPFEDGGNNSLGVLHKAIIVTPDDSKQRIVNSTMLALGEVEVVNAAQQEEFVTTDQISQKNY